jgi:hypothetical protein
MMLVSPSAFATAVPTFPPAPDQARARRAGVTLHVASWRWLCIDQGVIELRTCQDVLLPMLPAQEILS